jgi:hypothetical protein
VPLPLANTAEGGTNGVTVTTGNSGGASGDAFIDVTIGASVALIYDSAQAAHGGLAIKLTQAATPAHTRFGWTGLSVSEVYGRVYIYRTANPASGSAQFLTIDLSGTGVVAYFDINTSGQIRMFDSLGTSTGFTNAITLSAWNRFEFHVICAAGSGTIEGKLFLGDSATPVETKTTTTAQTRASLTSVFCGEWSSSDPSGVCWFDDIQANATGYPGPAAAAATANTIFRGGRGSAW